MRHRLLDPHVVLLVATLTTLACTTPSEAIVFYRRIALTGEQAPGLAPGIVFSQFGHVPGAGDDFAPLMDEEGNIVFHALLSGPGVTGPGIDDGNALSVWKHSGAILTMLARQDEPAPGTATGVEFLGFPSVLSVAPPLVANGHAAFVGGLRGEGVDGQFFNNAIGIWTDVNGPLELLLRNGEQVQGMAQGNVHSVISLPFFANTGHLSFNGLWRTPTDSPGSFPPNQEAFFSNRSGVMQPLVKGGDPAPGAGPNVTFGQEAFFAIGGAFRAWDTNHALQLAFVGNLAGQGIDDLNDEGVWAETSPGSFTLLAREGSPAPGASPGMVFGARNGIDCFGEIVGLRVNASGSVLFDTRMNSPSVGFMRGIWTNRSGNLELFVQGTIPVTDATPGDPAPGMPPGSTFSGMAFGDLNDEGHIAFTGAVTVNMDFNNQLEGIWWDRPGTLSLVAKDGDACPGTPPGVAFDGLNVFMSFGDDGTMVFLAGLQGTGVDGTNFVALVAVDPLGGLHKIARMGDSFDVSGSDSDFRVIERIVPGSVNVVGEIPFELGFTDGSSGMFVARIGSAVAVEGDVPSVPALSLSARPNPGSRGELRAGIDRRGRTNDRSTQRCDTHAFGSASAAVGSRFGASRYVSAPACHRLGTQRDRSVGRSPIADATRLRCRDVSWRTGRRSPVRRTPRHKRSRPERASSPARSLQRGRAEATNARSVWRPGIPAQQAGFGWGSFGARCASVIGSGEGLVLLRL
jgi:hypothetical protein